MAESEQIEVGRALSDALDPIARVIADTLQSDPRPSADGPAPIDRDVDAFNAAHGDPAEDGYRHPTHLLALVLSSRLYLIADTLQGIAVLGRHGVDDVPPVSYSAQAIARTTLDAAAFCYWLTEADIAYDERVRRLVQDTVYELKSGHRVAVYAREDGLRVRSSVEDVIDMCRAWHVTFGAPNNDGDFPKVGNRPSAGTIIAPLMKSEDYRYLAAALYSELSDVAHGSVSGILKIAERSTSPDTIDVYFARDQVLRRLLPLVWALHTPLTTAFEYLGWDAAELEKAFVEAVPILERVVAGDD